MKVDIVRDFSEHSEIDEFLIQKDKNLIYYSTGYYRFLKHFLKVDCFYLVIKDEKKIVAVLPCSIKRNDRYGNVLNSSPFYGSNGGVISNIFNEEIYRSLMHAFDELAVEENCASSTIITSPFETNVEWYNSSYTYDFKDSRIGQVTYLPDHKDKLMDTFHSKTRNTVRKAIKSIARVELAKGLDFLAFIAETHKENLTTINGIYKPEEFFRELARSLTYGEDFKIFVGFDENDEPIAGLLNLYFNKTVEYFTPVTVASHREKQGLSGLIYYAMADAVESDYKYWNWGGTWSSQDGVFNFKNRWGTTSLAYFYYTRLYDKKILELRPKTLVEEYQYFYVLPFSQLKDAKAV